jgi:serine/threonine protein kinase
LLERINVGGMAEVFRSKAFGVEGFERLVAVKRILPNIAEDKEFIKMFIDEAKIAVQLNHANIAQIFDLGRRRRQRTSSPWSTCTASDLREHLRPVPQARQRADAGGPWPAT